jgi:hypothetical protein
MRIVRGELTDCGGGAFGHLAEELDPAAAIELTARRDEVGLRVLQPRRYE